MFELYLMPNSFLGIARCIPLPRVHFFFSGMREAFCYKTCTAGIQFLNISSFPTCVSIFFSWKKRSPSLVPIPSAVYWGLQNHLKKKKRSRCNSFPHILTNSESPRKLSHSLETWSWKIQHISTIIPVIKKNSTELIFCSSLYIKNIV